ncbi:MAG: hypothetical protein Q4E05_11615 [Pseudoclavibacter sp.]|nr:hypothetical protein [Pseudoclavibacter sp.]
MEETVSIGYRAILRLAEGENAIDVAEKHVRQWVRSKVAKADPSWLAPGVHRLSEAIRLHVVPHKSEDGERRLYRLVERRGSRSYIVSLFVASLLRPRAHPQSIVVDVSMHGGGEADPFKEISPPRLVRDVLKDVEVHDGGVRLTGEPQTIGSEQIDRLLAAIEDPERTASVVVAVSPDVGADGKWRRIVASLTKESVGVASVFVVSAEAAPELQDALPAAYSIGPGRVRSFVPGARLDDDADAARHRLLGPMTLARGIRRGGRVEEHLQKIHARTARRRFVELELPRDVRRTITLLERAAIDSERHSRVDERVKAARAELGSGRRVCPPDAEAGEGESWLRAAERILSRWLAGSPSSVEALARLDEFIERNVTELKVAEEQISEAADRENRQREEMEELQRRLEDLELELALREESERVLIREAGVLRRRLVELGRAEDAYVEPDGEIWAVPDSLSELVQGITPGEEPHPAFQRIEFTGDRDRVLEVEQRDPAGRYARSFWQFVRVLFDYAEARASGFNGNVYAYLRSPETNGEKCPVERHAGTESESVQKNVKMRRQREFSVPTTVHPSGKALMMAHFKPTHRDTFAPRMHDYDDTSRSGKIYIGYIGRHLINTKT